MASFQSKGIDKHIKALKKLSGRKVEAGWFESARYGSTGSGEPGESVARIARINEFGAKINHPGGTKYIEDAAVKGRFLGTRFVASDFVGDHKVTGAHEIIIPARPFMRLAAANFAQKRAKIQQSISKQLLAGKITAEQTLGKIGEAMEGEIAKSIKNGGWQDNAKSTISKKGFNKPLIDTGAMLQQITSKVS